MSMSVTPPLNELLSAVCYDGNSSCTETFGHLCNAHAVIVMERKYEATLRMLNGI